MSGARAAEPPAEPAPGALAAGRGAVRLAPPSGRRVPLVGALPWLLPDPLSFLLAERSARGDLFTLDLGVTRVVVLCHPRHAQHVLRDHVANYRKGGSMYRSFRMLLGDGLVTSEGPLWQRQRRMIQPQFHKERLRAFAGLIVGAIDEAIAPWDAAALTAEPIDLARELPQLTMKVIVRTMFATGIDRTEADRVSALLEYVQDAMLRGVLTNNLPRWLPVPGRRRFERAIAGLDEVVFRVIERRRRQGGGGGDFIAMLLGLVDGETGEGMSDRQLRDEAVTMIGAGSETTATSLAWAFDLLTHHPAVLARLRAEVDEAVGDRRPTFDDLAGLALARRVMHEALRLYPPAWWMERTAAADDEIDGRAIPAGTSVVPVIHAIHRHPDCWERPDAFDPDRFTEERSAGRPKLAWMPFGSGRRQCIGKDFSLLEDQLALARILQRFDLEAARPRRSRIHLGTTLKPRDGVWVRLRRRTPRATAT